MPRSVETGHGRIETRRYWTMGNTEYLLGAQKWSGLKSIMARFFLSWSLVSLSLRDTSTYSRVYSLIASQMKILLTSIPKTEHLTVKLNGGKQLWHLHRDFGSARCSAVLAYSRLRCRYNHPRIISYRDIITIKPDKRGGRPCIRRMRITVYDVLGLLAAGMFTAEIIDDFSERTETYIRACLELASDRDHCLVASVSST